jgi:predicted RNA-binding Zn ribbon-like protein
MVTERMFEMSGGDPALDFSNTMDWRKPAGERTDRLESYADLVEWGRQAGVVDAVTARRLLEKAEQDPTRAAAVLEQARRVRQSIFEGFAAAAAGRQVPGDALAGVNAGLAPAMSHLRLDASQRGAIWTWAADASLDRVLWPVVRAASDLLTSSRLDQVRECAADTCGWLFIDASRNHSRRWCDMKVCGNRDKVRRHRLRER